MKQHLRQRFWIETALAIASAALLVITLAWKDWIEIVFRVDPDAGSGALEWAIVAVAVCSTLVFAALARTEWRRARPQPV
jgi:hypothetical protein